VFSKAFVSCFFASSHDCVTGKMTDILLCPIMLGGVIDLPQPKAESC
jgi:hypothetical protein